jgi:phospho-N-acetylmuramoyl-pentapeptide-transferase
MFYWIAPYLIKVWGPFRLMSSHLMLLAVGTMTAGILTWLLLPKLWKLLPTDKGKILASDGGLKSIGKPTGAGMPISLILLPVTLLFAPLRLPELGVLVCLYLCMAFGYFDDRSQVPWGELKKGMLDMLVAVIAAMCIYAAQGAHLWLPFVKNAIDIPLWLYVPGAAMLLWFTMNATNCSDGVDGLAGTLTLFSLFALVALLYGVVGYYPVADYLLIPHNAAGARWAILVAIHAGALAGYLWFNAEPSRVLMGDAGSRLLGMLVGVAVLVAGNPFLIFVVSPVVLVNGGTGLFKLVLLRSLRRIGFDVRPTHTLHPDEATQQHVFVKALHSIRFPLHDHCRKNMSWSNAQVLMRFALLQAFLIPLLFVILIKIR